MDSKPKGKEESRPRVYPAILILRTEPEENKLLLWDGVKYNSMCEHKMPEWRQNLPPGTCICHLRLESTVTTFSPEMHLKVMAAANSNPKGETRYMKFELVEERKVTKLVTPTGSVGGMKIALEKNAEAGTFPIAIWSNGLTHWYDVGKKRFRSMDVMQNMWNSENLFPFTWKGEEHMVRPCAIYILMPGATMENLESRYWSQVRNHSLRKRGHEQGFVLATNQWLDARFAEHVEKELPTLMISETVETVLMPRAKHVVEETMVKTTSLTAKQKEPLPKDLSSSLGALQLSTSSKANEHELHHMLTVGCTLVGLSLHMSKDGMYILKNQKGVLTPLITSGSEQEEVCSKCNLARASSTNLTVKSTGKTFQHGLPATRQSIRVVLTIIDHMHEHKVASQLLRHLQ